MTGLQLLEGLARDAVRTGMVKSLQRSGDLGAQLMNMEFVDDPYPLYDQIREAGPIFESKIGLVSADRRVVGEIFRHPKVGTATAAEFTKEGLEGRFFSWVFDRSRPPHIVQPISADSMIGLDPPDHTRLRKLAAKVFTPRAIRALKPRLVEIAHQLLDDVPDDFDLMRDFAKPLPILAICEVLGIPGADRSQFSRWGNDVAVDLDFSVSSQRMRQSTQSLIELNEYFEQLFDERRRNPGDDLISELIEVSEDGESLSARELMGTCLLLLVAGFETTVNLFGNGMLALLAHPDQLQLLRDDSSLMPGAIEEMLRYDAPVQMTARIPLEPFEAGGRMLTPDREISLMIGGANRDPAVFEDPNRLDITRPNAKDHLAFASGPHYCLGAYLARIEAEVGFTALFERFDRLELAGPPRRRNTMVLRGLESLPLRTA